EDAAALAESNFTRVFQDRKAPEEIAEFAFSFSRFGKGEIGEKGDIVNVLVSAGMAKSRGEAKRLIAQGGVQIDGEKITSDTVSLRSGSVVRAGKRNFVRLIDKDLIK
ncbi:MAG: S4 domain-containing protein, partial [Dehalococcoidia bacterium]|nr:S4 domain-containing protein [Dehalococcoidia bacterium]